MADVVDPEAEEAEPEPEPTDEEKVTILKDQLRNGEIGPSKFDAQFVGLWMKMVENKLAANDPSGSAHGRPSLRRGATRSSLNDGVSID